MMPRRLATLTLLVALASTADDAIAQATTVDIGLGYFGDFPVEFTGTGCDNRNAGVSVGFGRAVASRVTVGVEVTWTGSLATQCSADALIPSLPAPVDGDTYTYSRLDATLRGETFVASRFDLTAEPWQAGPFAARVSVSAGRLWDKQLWTWTYGPGARYALGRHALVLSVERWNLAYDVREETWIYRESGPDELQAVDTIAKRPKPWLLRLGWEIGIGE